MKIQAPSSHILPKLCNHVEVFGTPRNILYFITEEENDF
jgi:hypothetical protein